jgi:hypothetical protein
MSVGIRAKQDDLLRMQSQNNPVGDFCQNLLGHRAKSHTGHTRNQRCTRLRPGRKDCQICHKDLFSKFIIANKQKRRASQRAFQGFPTRTRIPSLDGAWNLNKNSPSSGELWGKRLPDLDSNQEPGGYIVNSYWYTFLPKYLTYPCNLLF